MSSTKAGDDGAAQAAHEPSPGRAGSRPHTLTAAAAEAFTLTRAGPGSNSERTPCSGSAEPASTCAAPPHASGRLQQARPDQHPQVARRALSLSPEEDYKLTLALAAEPAPWQLRHASQCSLDARGSAASTSASAALAGGSAARAGEANALGVGRGAHGSAAAGAKGGSATAKLADVVEMAQQYLCRLWYG